MQLSAGEFIDFVKEWILSNQNAISIAWPQKGGWESWAQTEIYNKIMSADSRYDVLREQSVYNDNRKACDFLLNSKDTGDNVAKVIIEIKCQSFENRDNFVSGLEDDAAKLIGEVRDKHQVILVILGIYFTTQLKKPIPEYFQQENISNEVGICKEIDYTYEA